MGPALLLDRSVPPRRRAYTEVVVLGAHATALWRRLELVDRCGASAPRLTVLVAPRPTAHDHPRRADGTPAELLGPGGRFPSVPGWRLPSDAADPCDLARIPLGTEAHVALLLLSRRWGLDVGDALGRLGRLPDGAPTVELDLGATAAFASVAVRRSGHGVAGTTAGTLTDWVAARRAARGRTPADRGGAGVGLVVTSRPHLLRTRRIVAAATAGTGLAVEVAAAPGPEHVRLGVVVGELRSLARSLRGAAGSAA